MAVVRSTDALRPATVVTARVLVRASVADPHARAGISPQAHPSQDALCSALCAHADKQSRRPGLLIFSSQSFGVMSQADEASLQCMVSEVKERKKERIEDLLLIRACVVT